MAAPLTCVRLVLTAIVIALLSQTVVAVRPKGQGGSSFPNTNKEKSSSTSAFTDTKTSPAGDRRHTNATELPESFQFQCQQNDSDSSKNDLLRPMVLAKLVSRGSNATISYFNVDQSIVGLTITVSGGTVKLWKFRDTLDSAPLLAKEQCCLTRVKLDVKSKDGLSRTRSSSKVGSKQTTSAIKESRQGGTSAEDASSNSLESSGQDTNLNGCREYNAGPKSTHSGQRESQKVVDEETENQPGCATTFSVQYPVPGLRILTLSSDSQDDANAVATAQVTTSTYLYFDYEFVNPITMSTLQNEPVAGEVAFVRVTFSCPWLVWSLGLIVTDENGSEVLYRGDLQKPNTTGPIFYFTVPLQNFYLGVHGFDYFKAEFLRMSSVLNRPKTVALSFVTPAHTDNLNPNNNLAIQFRLRNKGRADTFSVKATFVTYIDYFKAQIIPENLTVEQDESKEVHMFISVHKSISQKICSTLLIEVRRQSDNSSSFLSREVWATPTAFGEDKEPPSCTILSDISDCDPDLNCALTAWETVVAVRDRSGVYRASLEKPQSTRIMYTSVVYKQVEGRLMAQAHIRRDCCKPNMSLVVEDYIGNQDTCSLVRPPLSTHPGATAEAPGPDRADLGVATSLNTALHNKGTSRGVHVEEKGPSPTTTTTASTTSSSATITTRRSTTTRSTGDIDDVGDNCNLWSPRLLARLRLMALLLGCTAFVGLFVTALLCRYKKKSSKSRATRQPAFSFRRTRSSRGQRSGTGTSREGSNSNQLQMASLGKPQSESVGASGDSNPVEKQVSREILDDGTDLNADEALGMDSASWFESCSSTGENPSGRRCQGDEAYSSLHSSIRRCQPERNPSGDTLISLGDTTRWLSQLSSADFQPKTKTEIYENILQFRETLEQLEKKRTGLLNSMSFKHHTVPRIKHDIKQAPIDMDTESAGGRDNPAFCDETRNYTEGQKAAESSKFSATKVIKNIDTQSLELPRGRDNYEHELGSNLKNQADFSSAFSVTPLSATSSPSLETKDGNQGSAGLDAMSLKSQDDWKDMNADDEKLKRLSSKPSQSSLDLSQGHVTMLIEGATQISLRHEILKLRERLIQCSKEVEDAIRLEQDMYEECLSREGDGLPDSDCEDM